MHSVNGERQKMSSIRRITDRSKALGRSDVSILFKNDDGRGEELLDCRKEGKKEGAREHKVQRACSEILDRRSVPTGHEELSGMKYEQRSSA